MIIDEEKFQVLISQRHHIKYLGHICRLGNRAMQKQLLFDTRMQWKNMEKVLGVDRGQVRRAMMTKTDLMRLVDESNPTTSAPRPDMCPAGNTMMMMI